MSDDYADRTKAQLQAQLRERGLDSGGDTADLLERLRHADADEAPDGTDPVDDADDEASDEVPDDTEPDGSPTAPSDAGSDAAERARASLRSITGEPPARILETVRDDDVVRVTAELPEDADDASAPGRYEVELDTDGELVDHRRLSGDDGATSDDDR